MSIEPLQGGVRAALMALVLVATALGGYLTYASLVAGAEPPGCGADTGCGVVLSSRWSSLGPLPISALAVGGYLLVLVGMAATGADRQGARRAGWLLMLALAGLFVASAVWLTYVQVAWIGELCPYCMTGHALGILMALLILQQALWRRGPALQPAAQFSAVAAGVVLVGAVAVVQTVSPEQVHRLPDLPVGEDFDLSEGELRRVGMLGGRLHLALHEVPLLGSPDAPVVLAMLSDYSCPHCRHVHRMLKQMQGEPGGEEFAVAMLVMPLHRDCNPHAPEFMPDRFDHSCELARLALAVWVAEPGQFPAFDQWLFEPELPPSPEAARAEAERLVGASALAAALEDPRVADLLERHVEAYGDSGADRIPLLMAPGVDPIIGRVESRGAIRELIDQSQRAMARQTEPEAAQ